MPVVIGGPDATSSPHVYKNADFQVIDRKILQISSDAGRKSAFL